MMLYELKWPKLSVVTFRLSAAHQSREVRQLGKQPGSQPKCPEGSCWAPNGICALCPNAPAAKGPVLQHLPLRKCYSVLFRRGCYSSSRTVNFCCLPPFSPKWPGQVEVSFQEETLQKALMSCLAQGGIFLLLLAYGFLGQGTG